MPYQLQTHSNVAANTDLEHCCTVSIGVVVFAAAQASEDGLMRCADTAMYQAKSEGRNRVCFYTPAPV
jgi:diguanylate cyclase (GGDEF)-like protein